MSKNILKLHLELLDSKRQKVLEIQNIAVDTSKELTFFTKDDVKITFLYYPFKPFNKISKMENGLSLFPIAEIALQKAYTIGRRGEYRDYFDLYFILKNDYIKLNQLISNAKKVYGNVFDEKIFLEQLVYFRDLLSFEIISVDSKVLPKPKEVKQFFENLVKNYTK